MEINRIKLLENLMQLTDEQQQIALDFIEKTAEANKAFKKLSVYGTGELDLEADAGNIGFSQQVGYFASGRTEFEIFHTISKRFCKKDFGGATEAEQKQNIDCILLKKGIVLGRYFIGGANLVVTLDYGKPEGDSGKYIIDVMMFDEMENNHS